MSNETLFGVRVVISPWAPPDEVTVVGDFEKPEGWPAMSADEQMRYAVAHGAMLVMRPDVRDRLMEVPEPGSAEAV